MRPVSVFILLIVLSGCSGESSTVHSPNFIEKRLSFYDPADPGYTLRTWIRNPDNIRMAHASLLRFGYHNLYSKEDLSHSTCWIPGVEDYVNKPCEAIIDSLIISYADPEAATKYYREFWMRRKVESNDSVVFSVLHDLRTELFSDGVVSLRQDDVNDTIVNLLRIYRADTVTNLQAKQDFDFLVATGLHQSAYHLLFARSRYSDIEWEREVLQSRLMRDTGSLVIYPAIEDDTK